MGGSSKQKYYAVAVGRTVGIFNTWGECEAQVSGFPHARFKSFSTEEDAQKFMDENKGIVNKRVVVLPDTVNPSMVDDVPAACTHTSQKDVCPPRTHTHAEKRSREESHHDMNNNTSNSNSKNSDNKNNSNNNSNNNNNSEGPLPLIEDGISIEWMRAREEEAVKVYVDGACRSNGKTEPGRARGGYGGYYVPRTTGGNNNNSDNNNNNNNSDLDTLLCNFSLPLPDHEPQTNNRAELYAVIHVLQTALQARRCYNLHVYSDSTYVIRGANIFMPFWLKRKFTTISGSPVLNSDLWRRLQALRTQHEERYAARLTMEFGLMHTTAMRAARRLALRFEHVRGHSGVHGNVMADRLAVNGALRGIRR
ncbi:putative ribonuclease H1 [Trypanosoma theileri]|uniref:ribonuclease H n=1 Tax=Trypanosoma theileri TaxID=67003 RepID=A0A1X0NJL6_9TRYP|nr:putative ribonuclease H1 [Trypanosoma theileri]ORC84866.1 putative ribonuclease H1 [Trypanosoma theileri]